jgi:hypothetical protein
MSEAPLQRHLRWLVTLLVYVLTFEGVARKLQIAGTSVFIFLLKDFIVATMAVYVLRMRSHPAIEFLWAAYVSIGVLFLPIIMSTALHDPFLALFGMKEYLLYPIVAFAVFLALKDSTIDEIVQFFRPLAILIIPAVLVAIWELQLPQTHWLNLSVEGENLQGFSAGGELRVSSTFSFVAQFCCFLNAQIFIAVVALTHFRGIKWLWLPIYLALFPLLIIGAYVTGSRGAVVGDTMLIVIAAGLSSIKLQFRALFRVVALVGGLLITITVAQYFYPHLFAAYSAREGGQLIGVSGEIQSRVYYSFFSWMGQASNTPLLGYGIGVMSNGSDTISDYADTYRSLGVWTETDFATTLFEGGIYLVLIWYGFRYYVIFQTLRRFLLDVRGELTMSAAFCQAFVILIGMTGTLGIQPPVAIWWWLAVGTSLLLSWKCVEPVKNTPQPEAPAPVAKKIRGRSAYADRLHRK